MDFEPLAGYDKAKWRSLAEAVRPEARLFTDAAAVDAKAGVVWVTCFDEGDITRTSGGCKQPGNAKGRCFESLLTCTQETSARIRLA